MVKTGVRNISVLSDRRALPLNLRRKITHHYPASRDTRKLELLY